MTPPKRRSRRGAAAATTLAAMLSWPAPASSAVLRRSRSIADSNRGRPLKETWPWYHSAEELRQRLGELAAPGGCRGADLQLSQRSEVNAANAAGEVVQLDVLHISPPSGSSQQGPATRALLVFGEHAREVISPESALHFVEALCGGGPQALRASGVLGKGVSFTIVPMANPLSRKLVEDGYYCKRTNEDGVDLNRNFGDSHRPAGVGDMPGEEMNPGPSGFSEPESRIIRALVDEERPDIYLSIHSGAYLLGTPFGYTSDQVPDNEAEMVDLLRPISKKYCAGQCPYGNLAKLIHYENPGCDIDYVREAGTPYAFTWEIFVGQSFRQRYIEQAMIQNEETVHGGMGAAADDDDDDDGVSFAQKAHKVLRGGSSASSSKKKRTQRPEVEEEVSSCMEQFNPQTEEETRSVTERWTNAYLELCEEVVAKRSGKSTPPAAAPADATTAAGGAAKTSDSPLSAVALAGADGGDEALSSWPGLDAGAATGADPATAAAAAPPAADVTDLSVFGVTS